MNLNRTIEVHKEFFALLGFLELAMPGLNSAE